MTTRRRGGRRVFGGPRVSNGSTPSVVVSEFIEVYPNKWGYFQMGRQVAYYRPTGAVDGIFKVYCLFPNSDQTYRSCTVRGESVAREVCVEYGEEVRQAREYAGD